MQLINAIKQFIRSKTVHILLELNCLVHFQVPYVSAACNQFCNIPSAWIPQAQNVCHGATGDAFGTFRIKQDCLLVAIRLTHVSGILHPSKNYPQLSSRWGCKCADYCGSSCLSTVIIKDKKLWFPGALSASGYHGLNEFDVDDVLIMKKSANLTAGKEFQIGFGRDFINLYEDKNAGRHCVDIDISCLV